MSFRELRTLTETLRLLGYERPVSVESFRTPNIELVADIVYWLAKRYDPASDIAFDIEREQSRVIFFRSVCEAVHAKTRMKLSIKKLYQADGYAVQELLKLALLLKEATKLRLEEPADYAALQAQIAQRGHQEAKAVRQLCTDLTSEGSNLFFLLDQEMQSRALRSRIITRATEVSDVERRLRDLLATLSQQIEQAQAALVSTNSDEQTLEQKIEGKKAQLDRAQKRIKSLLNVRPAFMEEYEKHETELHQLFVVYLEQYRNLEYLEFLLAKFNKVEDEILASQERKLKGMRDQLKREELRVLRGEVATEDGVFTGGSEFAGEGGDADLAALAAAQRAAATNAMRADHSRNDIKRPRAASGRQRPGQADGGGAAGPASSTVAGGGAPTAVKGSMQRPPADESEEDDSDEDSDADTDDEDDNLSAEDGSDDSDGGGSDDSDEDDSDESDEDED